MSHDISRVSSRIESLKKLGLALPCSTEDVKEAYLQKVKHAHPDAGGSVAEFNELQQAFEEALQYAEVRSGRLAWIGAHVEEYAEQQQILTELERYGARIEMDRIDWIKQSFGPDFSQLVEKAISLTLSGRQFGDDTIAFLMGQRNVIAGVHRLDLSGSQVSDRSVRLLASLEHLRSLDLRQTRVTSRCLPFVEEMPRLEWIGLPRRASGLLRKLGLRWRHPGLHIAGQREACPPARD